MNDPNAPFFDPVHGVIHHSYQKWINYPSPPYRPRVYAKLLSLRLSLPAYLPVYQSVGLMMWGGTANRRHTPMVHRVP